MSNQIEVYIRHIELLGFRAKDKVTGYEGVIDGVNFELYGCIQLSLAPGLDDNGDIRIGKWFDVTRLEIKSKKRVMDLPNFTAGYIAEGKKGAAHDKPSPRG